MGTVKSETISESYLRQRLNVLAGAVSGCSEISTGNQLRFIAQELHKPGFNALSAPTQQTLATQLTGLVTSAETLNWIAPIRVMNKGCEILAVVARHNSDLAKGSDLCAAYNASSHRASRGICELYAALLPYHPALPKPGNSKTQQQKLSHKLATLPDRKEVLALARDSRAAAELTRKVLHSKAGADDPLMHLSGEDKFWLGLSQAMLAIGQLRTPRPGSEADDQPYCQPTRRSWRKGYGAWEGNYQLKR